MAYIVADRIKETSTTTGAGAFALAGAVTGFKAFSAAKITFPFTHTMAVGDTFPYAIVAVDSNDTPTGEWEVGEGTYSAANTLTRTRVTSNSAGTVAAIAFSAGKKEVMLVASADMFCYDRHAPYNAVLTVYVDPVAGNSTNDGLSASRPVSAISLALTRLKTYAWHVKSANATYATLSLADGVYDSWINVPEDVVLDVCATTGDASTVTISCSYNNTLVVNKNASVIVYGVTIASSYGDAVRVEKGGVCEIYSDVVFDETDGNHITCLGKSIISAVTINGGANCFMSAQDGGVIDVPEEADIHVNNTPAFSTAFAEAKYCGIIRQTSTFSGPATGRMYAVSSNGVIYCPNGFPGSVVGTASYGGQYAT